MKFNINHDVKVRLTERGHKILLEQHIERNRMYPKGFPTYAAPKEDADGWSTWQPWRLMQAFGEHVYNGCEMPSETEIDIPQESLE